MRSPIALLCYACLATTASIAAGDGSQQLFNGKDLAGWETFLAKPPAEWDVPGMKRDEKGNYSEPIGKNKDPLKVFTVETVEGRPAIHVSGQGFGVMTTTGTFGNFHLRLQFKWGEKRWASKAQSPRDCGLLYFVHGEPGFDHGTWPRSVEFQIQEHDTGDLYALGAQISVRAKTEMLNGRTAYRYDPAGVPTLFVQKAPIGNRCMRSEDAEKPNGEWNTLDLFCIGDDSIHVVNGKVVMRLQNAQRLDGPAPAPITAGQISLQTEGAEVFYRDVHIAPVTSFPAEFVTPSE